MKTAKLVRLGFFANLTHAPALVAIQRQLFEKYLKQDGTKIEYTAFNAGPTAIEAMKGNAIDATFIGPNPSISGFASTEGSLLKIVAGATSGGAQLVVKQSINSIADLKGKTIATPQLGNTQDVAARAYFASKGLTTSISGAGDVLIQPTENSQTLTLFKQGTIDGAWLPEPWASRLVTEANAKVLLDEKRLWKNGKFVTTQLISNSTYLKQYPGTVRSLIRATIDAINWAKKNEARAKNVVQAQLLKWTSKNLSDAAINRAWGNLRFTWDPIATSLRKSANNAVKVGLLTNLGANGLSGIYDLRLLNAVLKFNGKQSVTSDGLGKQ